MDSGRQNPGGAEKERHTVPEAPGAPALHPPPGLGGLPATRGAREALIRPATSGAGRPEEVPHSGALKVETAGGGSPAEARWGRREAGGRERRVSQCPEL